MLRQAVAENSGRIERTATTANGIQVLSVQLAEVIKDVGAVTADLARFRKEHLEEHQAERASRVSGRRWAIGTALVALASLWAPLVYIIGHVG